MKHIKTFKIFESISNIDEIKSNLKDLCLEFEDNNCQCEIEYSMLFYIDIDIDRRIILLDSIKTEFGNRKLVSRFPDWFIENCKEIESYMDSEGFKTLVKLYSIYVQYPVDWEQLDSVDELSEAIGLIYRVRLEFLPL